MQRWICRDPLQEQGGLNLYAYCNNDPVNGADPLGLTSGGESGESGGVGISLRLTGDGGQELISGPTNALVAAPTGYRNLDNAVTDAIMRSLDEVNAFLAKHPRVGSTLKLANGTILMFCGVVTSEAGVGIAVFAIGADTFMAGAKGLKEGTAVDPAIPLGARKLGGAIGEELGGNTGRSFGEFSSGFLYSAGTTYLALRVSFPQATTAPKALPTAETMPCNGCLNGPCAVPVPGCGGVAPSTARPLFYRYIGDGEADVIRRTGKIPNVDRLGNPKDVYFTNRLYKTAGRAKTHNQLPCKPTYRVEIDPTNVPNRSAFTRIEPAQNPQWGAGGGMEATTEDAILVDPSTLTRLRGAP